VHAPLEARFCQTGVTVSNYVFNQNAIQNDHGEERNAAGGFDVTAPIKLGVLFRVVMKVRDSDRTRELSRLPRLPPPVFV
jgi:hypothetical protein